MGEDVEESDPQLRWGQVMVGLQIRRIAGRGSSVGQIGQITKITKWRVRRYRRNGFSYVWVRGPRPNGFTVRYENGRIGNCRIPSRFVIL